MTKIVRWGLGGGVGGERRLEEVRCEEVRVSPAGPAAASPAELRPIRGHSKMSPVKVEKLWETF